MGLGCFLVYCFIRGRFVRSRGGVVIDELWRFFNMFRDFKGFVMEM